MAARPPLSEALVSTIIAGWLTLDDMPGNNPDNPDWTRLDSVLKVVVERWAYDMQEGE